MDDTTKTTTTPGVAGTAGATTTTAGTTAAGDVPDKGKALTIYVLYLVGVLLGITALIGFILAFVFKGDASPVAESHYKNQIGIFWRWIVLAIAAFIVSFVLVAIGLPAIIGTIVQLLPQVWFAIRSIKGLMALNEGRMAVDTGWKI